MKRNIIKFCVLALTAALVLALPAAAEPPETEPLVDEAVLTERIEDYLTQRGIPKNNVGIGFYYSGTDEACYYHGDDWFYSASMYKVPLTMAYAAREAAGELTAESPVGGLQLATIERYLLVNSNNEFAHAALSQLGGGSEPQGRVYYKQFADLPDSYYDNRFTSASFFTPRYMTLCMKTLYDAPENFPRIHDLLLESQPDDFFRKSLGGEYEIAQKYGAWEEWNGATAIVYTPHSIILTVMTHNVGNYAPVIAELGRLMADYALELDEALAERVAEQARLEEEQSAAELQLPEPTAQPQEPVPTAAPQPEAPTVVQPQPQTVPQTDAERDHTLLPLYAVLAAAAVGELVLSLTKKKPKQRRT